MSDLLRIFLSYARADDDPDYDSPTKSFLRRLYNHLTAEGVEVWWDREKLPSRGEAFTAEIEAAIRSCARFVLIVGPGAVASPYVAAEWRCALRYCLPITPILRAGDYGLIPEALRDTNAIDCRPSRAESAALRDIVNRLREDLIPLGQLVNVPPLPSGFVQREKPFSDARDAIRADAIQPVVVSAPPRATTVYGHGGIGKSTLAAALATDCDVRRRFRDGVYWIEIGQNPEIARRQADLGALLGDAREHYNDPSGISGKMRLSHLLADKQALIMLDDVWHHAVVDKFPIGGACRLLLTTRSRQIAGLVEGKDVPVDLLTPDEGARIIAARAGGSADDEAYRQISEELGGLTLAITLAAARLQERGTALAPALLARLRRPDRLFRDLKVHEDDKNLNLEKSLSLSYESLGAQGGEAQRRFRALGVLAPEGTFDRAVLQAIWRDADELDTEDAIDILVRAGLVEALTPDDRNAVPALAGEGSGSKARYSLHRLLRAYGRALLIREGELDAAFGRYADHVTAAAAPFKADKPEEWGAFEADLAPHLLEVGDELARRMAALTPGPSTAGEGKTEGSVEGKRLVSRAMSAAEGDLRQRQASAEQMFWEYVRDRRLGGLEFRSQYPVPDSTYVVDFYCDESRLVVELDGPSHAQQQAADAARQETLESLGYHVIRFSHEALLTDPESVLSAVLDAHRARRPSPAGEGLQGEGQLTDRALAFALNTRGYLARRREVQRIGWLEMGLAAALAKGDRRLESLFLNELALNWSVLGEPRKALMFYERALPIDGELGDRLGRDAEATTLNNIGLVWDALGEPRKALEYFEQVLPLDRASGGSTGQRREAMTLNNIGAAWFALGEPRKALEFYEQALLLKRAADDRGGQATTLSNIGRVWSALGEPRQALEFYEQALPLDREVGDRRAEATTLNNIGATWLALKQPRQALEHFEQALPLLRTVGYRPVEATTLNNIGAAWSALGEKRQALDYYAQALPLVQAVGDRGGEATTCYNMAMLHRALGDLDQAVAHLERCVTLEEQVEHPDLESDRRMLEQVRRERDSSE